MNEKKKVFANKEKMKPLIASGVAVLLLAIGFLYVVVKQQTKELSENPAVVAAAGVFRIPAMEINDNKVSYTDYIIDIQTLRTFFESQGLAAVQTDEDLAALTVSRLLAAELIEDVADDLGVEVTEEEIDARRTEMIAGFGSEELAREEIERGYGRTLEEFVQRVLVPVILEEKVREAFEAQDVAEAPLVEQVSARHILLRVEEDTEDALVKQTAQGLIDQLNSGADFAELAKQHGQDDSASFGGDLGFFGRGAMVQPFEDAVFSLQPGEVSKEPVKTQFGYHVVETTDRRQVKDFDGYMDQLFRNADIELYIDVPNPFEDLQAPAEADEAGDAMDDGQEE